MSQFYASIEGSRGRGVAIRQGSKKSGISGNIRGWDIGVRVHCYVNSEGQDECKVTLTAGLNGIKPEKNIGIFTAKDLS